MKTTLTLEDVERLEEVLSNYKQSPCFESEAMLLGWSKYLLPLILPVIREYVKGNPEGLRPPAQASLDQGTDVPRAPMEHKLKVWKEFFPAILSEAKPFEVRFNDRGFRVGDRLTLEEYDPECREYTGRSASREVLYVLHGWGLKDGFVCMGLSDSDEVARTAQGASPPVHSDVPPEWRELQVGEILQEGDEGFYGGDVWKPISEFSIGDELLATNWRVRRRIPNPSDASLPSPLPGGVEQVKASQEGSVCEVERVPTFLDEAVHLIELVQMGRGKEGYLTRAKAAILMAATRLSSPPSSEDTGLLDWLESRWKIEIGIPTQTSAVEAAVYTGTPIREAIRLAMHVWQPSATSQKGA